MTDEYPSSCAVGAKIPVGRNPLLVRQILQLHKPLQGGQAQSYKIASILWKMLIINIIFI